VVDQFELIALPYDLGMFPRDTSHSSREMKIAGWMAADSNHPFGEFLNLAFHRAMDVDELDDYDRGTFHRF
jgi:hypothetical protein